MKTACCIVLAAFLALVSAECDLKYKSGDVCIEDFREAVKASFAKCKGNGPEKNEDETEVDWHKLSDDEKKAFHAKCEEMQQCVEKELTGETASEKVKEQYGDIQTFCTETTSEANNDEAANKPTRNRDFCVKMNVIQCCGLHFGHGGKHGKGGRNGHEKGAEFVAIDKQFMSMFN